MALFSPFSVCVCVFRFTESTVCADVFFRSFNWCCWCGFFPTTTTLDACVQLAQEARVVGANKKRVLICWLFVCCYYTQTQSKHCVRFFVVANEAIREDKMRIKEIKAPTKRVCCSFGLQLLLLLLLLLNVCELLEQKERNKTLTAVCWPKLQQQQKWKQIKRQRCKFSLFLSHSSLLARFWLLIIFNEVATNQLSISFSLQFAAAAAAPSKPLNSRVGANLWSGLLPLFSPNHSACLSLSLFL